jgi:hypothetical protein
MASTSIEAQKALARKLHEADLLADITSSPFEYLAPAEQRHYLRYAEVALQKAGEALPPVAAQPQTTPSQQKAAARIRVAADRKNGREPLPWILALAQGEDELSAHMAQADDLLQHLPLEEGKARDRSWTEAAPAGEPVPRNEQYSVPSVTELAEMLLKLPKDHKIFNNSQGGYDCKCGARWDWTKAEKELADSHVARVQAAALQKLLSATKR